MEATTDTGNTMAQLEKVFFFFTAKHLFLAPMNQSLSVIFVSMASLNTLLLSLLRLITYHLTMLTSTV